MASETSPETITRLLERWSEGDQDALAKLVPVVYDELRSLAAAHLRRERSDHSFTTTDLIHEAYLRLADLKQVQWQNRTRFFALATRMMRQILVDHARSHLATKRGSGARKLALDEALTLSAERAPELVALDDALNGLAGIDPRAAQIVELRFFAGLKMEEIGRLLGMSTTTVGRKWRTAQAWLYRAMAKGGSGDG